MVVIWLLPNFRTWKLTQNFFKRANPRRCYPPTCSRSLFRRVKSVYKAVSRSYSRSYVEEMTETRGGRAEFADGRHIAKFNSSMCWPIARITSGGTTTRTTRRTKTTKNIGMRKKYYIRSTAFTVNTRICVGDPGNIREKKRDVQSS